MADHINERMKTLSTKIIPDGCKELSDKNAHIAHVIPYLENSYSSAVHAGGDAERAALNVQAKTYIVDILSNVSADIESLATNLNTYVSIQGDAVDSLANQVDVVRTRLMLATEAVGLERLNDLRLPVLVQAPLVDGMEGAAAGAPAAGVKGSKAKKSSKESAAAATAGGTGGTGGSVSSAAAGQESSISAVGSDSQYDSLAMGSPNTQARRRLTMEERMSAYDNVGVCLSKESMRGGGMGGIKKEGSGLGGGSSGSTGGGASSGGSVAGSTAGSVGGGSVTMMHNPLTGSSAFSAAANAVSGAAGSSSSAVRPPPTLSDMKQQQQASGGKK